MPRTSDAQWPHRPSISFYYLFMCRMWAFLFNANHIMLYVLVYIPMWACVCSLQRRHVRRSHIKLDTGSHQWRWSQFNESRKSAAPSDSKCRGYFFLLILWHPNCRKRQNEITRMVDGEETRGQTSRHLSLVFILFRDTAWRRNYTFLVAVVTAPNIKFIFLLFVPTLRLHNSLFVFIWNGAAKS